MIQRIELINFMSHPHTVLELDHGLTVLVGDNNTGKSAIVNALQVLCTNAQGDYMVRHGEKECLVRVVTSEGHEVEWKRKGRAVSYTINGRDVHRLGGSVPEDLHDLLRLPRVETETETFDIHFGEQKDPIFLLNTSPGKRATFFASSSDTIKLIEMQNLHKKKVQDAKWKEARLKQDEARHSARLTRLEPVQQLGERLDKLEAAHSEIAREQELIAGLKQKIKLLEKAIQEVADWNAAAEAVRPLTEPPRLEETAPLQTLLANLRKQERHIGLERARGEALQALQAPPALTDTGPLNLLIHSLQETDKRLAENRSRTRAVRGLQPPPVLQDTSQLQSLVSRCQELARAQARCRAELGQLSRVGEPPALDDVHQLQDLMQRLEKTTLQADTEGLRSHILQDLGPPPKLEDLEGLARLLQEMHRLAHAMHAREQVRTRLAPLKPPPQPVDPSDLQACLSRLDKASRQVQLRSAELDQVRSSLDQAEQELREFVALTGVCPTCGQEMDPESIMQHEHARTTTPAPTWKGGE